MSTRQEKKRKHQNVTSDTNMSDHDEVKKKKRKILNPDVKYTNSSDTEDTPRRKSSKTQMSESAPSTGVNYNGEQRDQEHEDTSTKKKKKRKEESDQEADDITAGGASSALHRKHNNKSKKSDKVKDSDRIHKVEGVTEEEPVSELTHLEGKSKKKKKKSKKDQPNEDCLMEESLALETPLKGGEGLQEDDDEGRRRRNVTEEHSRKTPEKIGKSVKKKRKEEADGMEETVAESSEKMKKSHKTKDKKRFCEEESNRHKGTTEKTKRKHHKNTEQGDQGTDQAGDFMEELLVPEVHHTSKKKKKQKNDDDLQEGGLPLETLHQLPVRKKKRTDEAQQEEDDFLVFDVSSLDVVYYREDSYKDTEGRKKKKKHKKDHGERLVEDRLEEEELVPETQHKKKKNPDGSTAAEQMEECKDGGERLLKKKKKRKDDRTEDEAAASAGLGGQEPTYGEDGTNQKKKKSPKKDHRERPSEVDHKAQRVSQRKTSHGGSEKKAKNRKHKVTRGETSEIPTEELSLEDGGAEGNPSSDVSRTTTAKKIPRRFIREKDIAMIKSHFPNISEKSLQINITELDMVRIRNATKQGIMFRTGQFTIEEDEQIKRNVEDFILDMGIESMGIESPVMLLHPHRFPEMKGTIRQLKRKFHFLQRLADGLHRCVHEVSVRACLIYDPSTVKGRYSNVEERQLKKLQKLHGKDWLTISMKLNRNARSPSLKASSMLPDMNTGPWSEEEMNCLISAVKEFVLTSYQKENKNREPLETIPKENLYTGISWVRIQDKVGTRNSSNCKRKWFQLLLLRMNNYVNPLAGLLAKEFCRKMIKWLYDSGCKDYGDVKWDKLSNDIGNIPPFITQNKFISLKQKVPGWKKMRLYEVVNRLYTTNLPRYEAELSKVVGDLDEPERRDHFLISEIFHEYAEDEALEKLPDGCQ